MSKWIVGAVAAAIVAGGMGVAYAQDAAKAVDYRKGVMRTQAAQMGGISMNLKGEVNAKQNLKHHAEILHQTALMQGTLWPKGSEGGRTKPEIWSDWAKAEAIIKDFTAATENLVKVAATGDAQQIGAAMGAVGKGCQSCHAAFQMPQ